MHQYNTHSRLVRIAFKLLKYFLLGIFGLTVVCILSATMGALHLASMLLSWLAPYVLRTAMVISSFMAITVVVESLRD